MNPLRKPRPESPLKNLPEVQQAALLRYLSQEGVTLAMGVAWLKKEHGIETSESALSRWRAWRLAKVEVGAMESAAMAVAETIGADGRLTPDQIRAHGQRLFSLLALAKGDGDLWVNLQHADATTARARLAERELNDDRERWEFDIAATVLASLEQLTAVTANPALDYEAKRNAIRQRLFGASSQVLEHPTDDASGSLAGGSPSPAGGGPTLSGGKV